MDVFLLCVLLCHFGEMEQKKRPQKCDRIIFQTDETYLILMKVLNGSMRATVVYLR